jgi:hypothetical protein
MTAVLLTLVLAQLPPLPGSFEQRQQYQESVDRAEHFQRESERQFRELRREHQHEELLDALRRQRDEAWE